MGEHLRSPGEIVALTHTDLPDITSGTIGVTDKYYEITQRTIVFPRKDGTGGYVDAKLLFTGYTTLTSVISDLSIELGAASADQQADFSWINEGDTIGL